MKTKIPAYGFAGLLASAMLLTLAGCDKPQDPQPQAATTRLFSEEDAVQLRLTESEWEESVAVRDVTRGPLIVLQTPPVEQSARGPLIATTTPVDLVVLFEENEAPVDMASLSVRAKKGIFSKSLTDTLKPYIDGTTVKAKGLDVPTGKFKIEIQVADTGGERTKDTYRLEVSKR